MPWARRAWLWLFLVGIIRLDFGSNLQNRYLPDSCLRRERRALEWEDRLRLLEKHLTDADEWPVRENEHSEWTEAFHTAGLTRLVNLS